MLVSPALAFLTLVINFYAIIHIVSNRSGLTARTKTGSKWQVLYVDIFPLEEATTATYETDLDTTALPPLASPPIYSTTLHQAEWAYRSSAVRILDLVDGTQKVRTAPGVITPPSRYQSSPSPTKQTDPIVSTGHLPPTLTSPIYPATFKPFPTYNPSIPSVATSSVAQSLGFTGFVSCLAYALVFVWMKNRGSRPRVYASRPRLTCDVNLKAPAEIFHSIPTVTSIPSYPRPEPEGSSGGFRGSRVGFPAMSRVFPVVFTGSDGKDLFKAEIKLSSNHAVTEVSANTSTVSFSIDVIASLDIPSVPEWYMPGKEDGGSPPQADDSVFLLLVRGSSDRAPSVEEPGASHCPSEFNDAIVAGQTPPSDAPTLVSDCEVEDTDKRDVSPLGSPMCPITIPIHYRGFSSFETALINSATMTRRKNTRKGNASHRGKGRANIRPKDVPFPWLKDLYTCGDNHLYGCPCDEIFAEGVHNDPVFPETSYDHSPALEFDRETDAEEGGSGMCKWASAVSPGLSVRSEMSLTDIFDPAEPRPTVRSDPSLADGKEPAGLDSTAALLPSFSVGSPELSPRCRSGEISSPAESSDGAFGEESVASEGRDVETGSTSECTGMNRFVEDAGSPPSPVVPAQVNSLLDALEPILGGYTSPPSPEDAKARRTPPPPSTTLETRPCDILLQASEPVVPSAISSPPSVTTGLEAVGDNGAGLVPGVEP